MGKPKRRSRARPEGERQQDATPERLAKGDAFEFVNPGQIDSSEQPLGRARRFTRVIHLDRWHRASMITQRQWWAGVAYRTLHEGVQKTPRLCAAYGERTTGGETDYGMARTMAQARKRRAFRAARASIDTHLLGTLDRFILQNALPRTRGRAHMSVLASIRQGLDGLAEHFERRSREEALDNRNILWLETP